MADDPSSYIIRPVKNFNERCQTWHLVYRKYLESGFISPHASGLFFSLLDLLPLSSCWVATQNGKIIGTMSIVINTTSGLPGGKPYDGELHRLGVDGRVVGEFTKLAVEDSFSSSTISADLMAAMICSSMENNLDDIICVVHPRHARAWCHMFGWQSLGEVKSHAGVNSKPGILLHMDLKRSFVNFDKFPQRGQRLLRKALDRVRAANYIFRPSGCETTAVLAQCPKLFSNSTSAQRIGIERHYPWASQLLRHILEPNESASTLKQIQHSLRPQRDRSIIFPNEASRRKVLAGEIIGKAGDWDQLLFPDAPIACFIDEGLAEGSLIREALEDSGLIMVNRSSRQPILDMLKQHLSDLIVTTLPNDHPELKIVTSFIRQRDALLDLHTPIVNISELLGTAKTSLIMKNLVSLPNSQLSRLREFSEVLNLITTGFDDISSNEIQENSKTELRLVANT